MTKGRYKILLLVMVMVLTTFSAGFTDYDGNESYEFKTEGYGDSTWYFNEDGDHVDGPTEYWVKFFVSSDGMYLNYETNNMTISGLNVKGGDGYRVYSDSDLGGKDFRAPDNNGGNVPQISHYSFLMGRIIPLPTYDVTVNKIIEGDIPLAGYEFTLDGQTVITDADGIAVFTGIEAGIYRLREHLNTRQANVFEAPADMRVDVVDDDVSVDFVNTLKGVAPMTYDVTVNKIIEGDIETTLAGYEFTLDGQTVITDADGIAVFTGIEAGIYRLREHLNTRQANAFEAPADMRVDVIDEDVSVRFVNTLLPDVVVDEDEAQIEITKIVIDEEGTVIQDDSTFFFMIQEPGEVAGTWDDLLIEPLEATVAASVTSEMLPLGQYRVIEVNLSDAYEVDFTNGLIVDLDTNGEISPVTFTNTLLTIDEVVAGISGVASDDDTERERTVINVTEPEDEVLTIVTEPTPQAPPVIVVEQLPVPEPEPELVLEVEVVEETTPQATATLPRTGASDPTVFAGFGAALMALGLYLNKKKF